MNSQKILSVQVVLLLCGLTLAPCYAKPLSKAKITKVKLTVNDVGAAKTELTPPHLSEVELQKLAELKSKFADSIDPKMTELHSLHRQMMLMMSKLTVDRAQILQLQSRINSINSDIANSRLNFQLDLIDDLPTEAKDHMRKYLLFDLSFGPELGFSGPPPPGLGLPPTCVPPPGFGLQPPLFGPPPMMGFPSVLRTEGMNGLTPGRGPGGAPFAPPFAF